MFLKQCCCGCSLRTGSLTTAYTSIIGNAIGATQAILWFVFMSTINSAYYNVMYSVSLGISIIQLICSILLVMAVKKRRPKLAILWLIETAIVTGASSIFSIILLVFGAFIEGGILLLTSGFGMYFWWVVFSFYHELKMAEEIGNRNGTEDVDNINNKEPSTQEREEMV